MEVFRIAWEKHSKSLNASGKEGRWNKEGQFVLYTAQHRSLATLEMTVHKAAVRTALRYETMILSVADDEKFYTRLLIKDMPKNWRYTAAPSALQTIGSEWYENSTSLILQVPSVIIPQEYNFIINTKHPDFSSKTVSLVRNEEFFWDDRLIIGN